MKNQFFKISFRQITRHKLFSLVNIFGLSIGIASVILISLWIADESSYDKSFPDYERLYRITQDVSMKDLNFYTVDQHYNSYYELREKFPEIECIARISKPIESFIKIENSKYIENRLFYADNSIIDLLGLEFLSGQNSINIEEPNTAIISARIAEKYFGTTNALGKTYLLESKTPIQVVGVFKNLPKNNHIRSEIFISIKNVPERILTTFGTNERCLIYLRLRPGMKSSELEAKFPEFVRDFYGKLVQRFLGISFDDFLEGGNRFNLNLQPITEAHFNKNIEDDISVHGDRQHIYILGLISVIILIVAIINFINLSSARALYRTKEVSIKKINGASRNLLIKQFTFEAIVYSLIALNIGLLIVEFLLPLFNRFTEKDLSVGYIENPSIILILLISGILVGIVSGIYPAFLISSFNPLTIFKKEGNKKLSGIVFRNILIATQFIISLSIITCTLIINKQLNYISNKDWGFDRNNFLIVKNITALNNQEEIIKKDLQSNKNIIDVTFSSTLPGKEITGRTYAAKGKDVDENVTMPRISVDFNFLQTYGFNLLAGRYFSADNISDINKQTAILNQAAVKAFGFENPVGERIYRIDSDHLNEDIVIVGVVQDFHFTSLFDEIRPCIIRPYWSRNNYMSIKLNKEDINETIQFVNNTWNKFSEQPFEYSFLEDDLVQLHRNEQRNKTLFFVFSFLSIVVSSLGLFGMTIFTISRKTKEIGIRKALGAPISNIASNLLMQTLIIFSVATLISVPFSYYFMNKWLSNFAYRINLNFPVFLISIFIVLSISFLTIIILVLKAAKANPIDSLRYE